MPPSILGFSRMCTAEYKVGNLQSEYLSLEIQNTQLLTTHTMTVVEQMTRAKCIEMERTTLTSSNEL